MYTLRRDAQKNRVLLSLVGMVSVDEAQKILEQSSKEYDACAAAGSLALQVDLAEYKVSVAEAVDLIAQNLAAAAKKKLTKLAFIMPDSNFVSMQMKRVVKQVGLDAVARFCSSAGEARKYLDA